MSTRTMVQIDNSLLQSLHRIANEAMSDDTSADAMRNAMREVQSLVISERIRIYSERYPHRVEPIE